MKVNEIFKGIQGEGKFAGVPMTFVRLSGCTRACFWCDTKYHTEGKEMTTQEVVNQIISNGVKDVCFTGGEPLLQIKAIDEVNIALCDSGFIPFFHIETNGDLLKDIETQKLLLVNFDYIACSPKEESVASFVYELFNSQKFDNRIKEIKVVFDGKELGKDMLEYADTIMPFTSGQWEDDKIIMKEVWDYCLKNNKRFSPRLQYVVFGQERGK